MESVAHCRRKPSKASVMLSNNNGGFSSKSLYDDVYGGPPKFGVSSLSPRLEDYSEIFGSFHTARATSIPVLDLPVVHETEAFVDPRSNAFNYTEVFGTLDFAISYDNLFHHPTGLDEQAWTSAETDSFSGESSHSGNNKSMSNGDLFRSVDGNTEFNISYLKVNGKGSEHMSKGETHMTRLHAVPGFSQVYDETTQSHWIDPSYQVADDIDLNTEFSEDKVSGDYLRKTMPCLHNFTSGEQTFGSDLNLQNGCGKAKNDSHSSEMFITVSDISLRSIPSQVPPPARPPPVLDAKNGDPYGFHSNGVLVASEETPSDSSPPFSDVEVDMNASGAASADAMKEAMLKAEAKLRSAKELKERKKWVQESVHESRLKSSHDLENNKAKMVKDMSRLNSLNDEAVRASYDSRHSKMKISATNERQEPRKASPETPNTLEGKIILNTFEGNHMKEPGSSQDSDTGVGIWKEESEFFELKGTEESGMVIQPTKPTKILMQDTRHQERGQKERETSNMQEEDKKVNATEENYHGEEYKKKSIAAKEAYKHNKNIMRSEASDENWRQREHVKKEKVAKIFELEENEKNLRIVHQYGKAEKKVTEADQSGSLENVSEMGHKEHKSLDIQKSTEVDRQTPYEGQSGMTLKGNEKKPKEVEKQQQSVKKHKQSAEMKENGKTQGEAFALGQAEHEEKLKDSVELEDIEGRSKEAFNHDNTREKEACRIKNEIRLKQILNKKGLKEAHERVEVEKGLNDSFKKEASDEGLKHAFRRDENEKRLKEDFELDVNEIRLKEAFKKRENNGRENEVYERDQNRKNFEKACDGYGEGYIPEEAGENKGIQKVLNQAPEKEWSSGMLNEAQRKKEIESTSNQTFGREGNTALSNENSLLEQYVNMDNDVGRMEKDKGLDKALDEIEGNEEGGNMKFTKATDETWKTERNENIFEAQSTTIHEEHIVKLEVSLESVAEQEIGKTRIECIVGEKNLEDVGVENQLANEKVRAPEVTPGDAEHSGTQSGRVDDTVTKADYRGSIETAEPATEQEAEIVQKSAQWFHVRQSTERKEKKSFNETPASVVKDAEKTRREKESEKNRLRKVEEERDREREREKDRVAVDKAMMEAEREKERIKDRMAVDRAASEAHDGAYAEACERAERAAFERATVDARQRALAEAKERLEKACAEARDKSHIDKAITEARLKAERAAVDRATAEAQECAVEKFKAERADFESRERLERSVSDKIGVCSSNGGRQDSSPSDMLDPEFQNFSSSTGSRYPYSLYGAASFSERSKSEGESARRCRARLERYRRTAERAAKALAEKNMRDLLAQKEQAERNRLAETLNAEVRRWSSGKEGNLRALLSTLQYILGPDSGWQPIPLTEVITFAAVKKAYRKATLCVHPDKLQQRGASIQHKYICEKVFDLLKDAWNKFNLEEW